MSAQSLQVPIDQRTVSLAPFVLDLPHSTVLYHPAVSFIHTDLESSVSPSNWSRITKVGYLSHSITVS